MYKITSIILILFFLNIQISAQELNPEEKKENLNIDISPHALEAKEKKENLILTKKLLESESSEDLVFAAKMILGREISEIPYSKLDELIRNNDLEVKIAGYRAISGLFHLNLFNIEKVQALRRELEEEITRSNIDEFFNRGNTKSFDEVRLFSAKADTLMSLYLYYPVISVSDYENWEESVYSYFILKILHYETNQKEEILRLRIIMIRQLNNFDSLNEHLEFIIETLFSKHPESIDYIIDALERHKILGSERAMNTKLNEVIKKYLDSNKMNPSK